MLCQPLQYFKEKMSTILKGVLRGDLPGQSKDKQSKSRERKQSPFGSASGDSERSGPNARVIPPEPVQQATQGDFSLTDSERPLQVHNLARASKLCKALEWSASLSGDAESYAKTMASTGVFERSGIETQGENIYKIEGDVQFEDAVDKWLNQEKKYTGDDAIDKEGGGLAEYGHFTQCVWNNTLYVGMGKARSKDGTTYIVARYTPPGNVQGQKPFVR